MSTGSLLCAMRKLLQNRKILIVAIALLIGLAILAIFAPWISPYDPYEINSMNRMIKPSPAHFFGTDRYGRDVFSRVVYGARLSLSIGLLVTSLVFFLGVPAGLLSGYFRALDGAIMRVNDALMSVPPLMLALTFVAIWGAGFINVIIALTITYTPRLVRVARASTLAVKEDSFIEAARAAGTNTPRILLVHILPNIISPIIVQLTITFAFTLISEASLSFLGVGVPPYVPSWGSIIAEGRDYMVGAPWLIVYPGVAIMLSVLALNVIGDGIRDVMDPRLRKEVK